MALLSYERDDEYIFSRTVSPHYLMRQPSMKWWYTMEDLFADVPVGTRLLIRRDIRYHVQQGGDIVTDYITTRVARETFYGHWTHQFVTYREDEHTPYGYDMNAYESRTSILSQHYNNMTEKHMQWMNSTLPLINDTMDEDRAREFLTPFPASDELPPVLPALSALPFPASFPSLSSSIPSSARILFPALSNM